MKKVVHNFRFFVTVLIFLFGASSIEVLAQTCSPAPVGLTSWWAADNNALDSRSRSNGTLTNGATLTAGHVGQAFSFDGNDDAVTMSSSDLHEPFSQLTVEAWVFPLSHGGGVLGRAVVSNSETDGFALRVSNGGFVEADLRLTSGDVTAVAGTNQLPLNQWSHIAFTYDGSQVKGYMNGTLAVFQNATGAVRNTANSNICLLIGNEPTTGCATQPILAWHGQIDEPAIYNRALSASEIAAIHAAGTAGKCKPTAAVAPSGLVAWYGGDGNANDTSGNNLNGTMQLGADFAIGKVGQAFRLQGGTQYVDLGPGFNLDKMTLEAWVFIDPATNLALRRIISKDNLFLGGTRKLFTLNSSCPPPGTGVDGGGCFAVLIGSSFDAVNAPSAMTSGWHHLAGVRDTSANRFEFYVDGVMVASTTPTVVGTIDSDVNTIIGRVNPVTGLEGFQGLVDEAGIFNRALTPEEITSIFNAGIAGKLKTATTPAGANVSTNVGSDATLNFSNISTEGTTQQIPLEQAVLPALPLGFSSTGLFYDIATTAGFTGNANVCFGLPSINDQMTFSRLKILHLESGAWTERTGAVNFATRTLCGQSPTLSPFAIVEGMAPTAASVTVGGSVLTSSGRGISLAIVTLTDASGSTRTVLTNPFGFYRFEEVSVGDNYMFSVQHKRYQFAVPMQSHFISGERVDIDFLATP